MVRVPVWTPQRVTRSLERIRRLLGPIRESRTYLRILYLLLALPLGVIEFSFLVTALSFGFGTAITLIGIPVLVATVWAWRWLAQFERRIIGRLLGTEIPEPYRPDPPDKRWWKRLGARLADPATWKDLAFLLLQLPLGIVSFSIAVSVIGFGLRLLLAPVFTEPFGDGDWIAWLDINSTAGAIAAVPLGALILLLGIPGLNALGRLYGWFAGVLLGSNADPALTAQVHELEDARSRIIAAADAERRRIERDLHDGAQQRLVALALNLRMAEQRVDAGEPGAAELVRQAGEEANLALKELRDLARGIHPAILTNRGLPAALEDLASRATVPVEVVATPGERLPDPVEAAAYFVVSECLANIGKHAEATSATVAVRAVDERLSVEVSDDGRGGASLDSGSGVQGLVDRVGALGGTLTVESPPGDGTRVVAEIPLTERDAADGTSAQRESRRVLPVEEADRLQGERRRRLNFRLGSLAIVAGVLVAIWALTDPGLPWIAWPLLGLGLVGGLDAWHVFSMPPFSEADLEGATDRGDQLMRLTRHRRLRHHIGAHVILNVFIVGVWVASNGTYFWPAWVMLGSAAAIAIKALPRAAGAHAHLLGDHS
jgi:signal transduction histidine kinase